MIYLILILSIILGVLTTSFVIYIHLLQKETKRLKNICKIVGNDIYNISSRLYSGNVSHSKGNIQNMANLIKQIGKN